MAARAPAATGPANVLGGRHAWRVRPRHRRREHQEQGDQVSAAVTSHSPSRTRSEVAQSQMPGFRWAAAGGLAVLVLAVACLAVQKRAAGRAELLVRRVSLDGAQRAVEPPANNWWSHVVSPLSETTAQVLII